VNEAKATWNLYILECSDKTFYTGITNDISNRLRKHNEGKASRYTRSRRPVKLVYKEDLNDRGTALRRELEIKSLSRAKKEALILNKF